MTYRERRLVTFFFSIAYSPYLNHLYEGISEMLFSDIA